MGTPIQSVTASLYRDDTNSVMQMIDNISQQGEPDANGVYTFTGVFTATHNSSFGLDENSFKIRVVARDLAGNNTTLENGEISEGEDENEFSMAVRVKEAMIPKVSAEQDAWPSPYKGLTNFVAKFIAIDENYINESTGEFYRLAGIDTKKVSIYLNDKLVVSPEVDGSQYFETYTSPTNSTSNDGVYRVKYELPDNKDGSYKIGIIIYDNDGNASNLFEKTVVVDISAPGITLTSPGTNPNQTGNFTVSGTVDSQSTVYIEVYKDEVKVTTDTIEVENLTGGNFSKDYINQPDGNYRIKVYAKDAAGNETAVPAIVEFVIDATSPIFKLIKFYPIVDGQASSTPTEELIGGLEYKIVVMVE